MEASAAKHEEATYGDENQQKSQAGENPSNHPFACHNYCVPPVLECLSQGHKELRGSNAGHRIQILTDIEPDRAHRRVVADSESYGVGVVVDELTEIDVLKDIAAIIKNNRPQILDNGKRESH